MLLRRQIFRQVIPSHTLTKIYHLAETKKKKFEKRANTISSQTPEGIIDLIVSEPKLSKSERKHMHKLDAQWHILQKQTNLIIIISL